MNRRKTGNYERLGSIEYFIPDNLPPKNPTMALTGEIADLYGECMHRLGQLAGLVGKVPNQQRFIKAYVIKEALLTSAIEGIHTTLLDVFTQPLSGAEVSKDTQLVINYTQALDGACDLLHQGMPLSAKVITRAHAALLAGEGDKANPGNYRKQTVRVGNLIPPPPARVADLMSDLERYIHDDELPVVIRAGLVHVQFETIHPFLDGNGRIGRLLIVLMLVDAGLLPAPLLYPSYFFKKYHSEYYMRLDRVRTHGDFEGWIAYYLRAIAESAHDAYIRACDIELLERTFQEKIRSAQLRSQMTTQLEEALSLFFQYPVISITQLAQSLGRSYNTADNLIQHACDLGILALISQQKRNRLYRFDQYLAVLEKEY